MDNEVIEDDDDINLESLVMKMMLLPDLEIKIILFMLKMKKMRMMMIIMMLVVEHLVHMMILISIFFITNEAWVLKLSSCLFETLKLICYLNVMNLFVICHLDVNVMTNELIVVEFVCIFLLKDKVIDKST